MPIPTPFHERTAPLCQSMRWKDWSGYYGVCAYSTYAEREYFAIRHSAGLMDVSPLFKYEVTGPDAAAFLARVMVNDIPRMKVGSVSYTCWTDDEGKLLDDGTIARLDEQHFRVTAAEPSLHWFHRHQGGLDVVIEDSTARIGALSLQGPQARQILRHVTDTDMDDLGFFRLARGRFDGFEATITRTGYTGDLGYEIWVASDDAIPLWDVLMDAGLSFGMIPNGLDALDMTRVEAGFIMNGVDYSSANHCLIESRKSTPYEAGLGWTVHLQREPFIGQTQLRRENDQGPERCFVGLEIDWDEMEALFAAVGLPPELPGAAWRNPVPIYSHGGTQIGYATSGSWSPMLKKNLALGTVAASHGRIGEQLRIEMTVEHVRHQVKATVLDRPFFDPDRKRS